MTFHSENYATACALAEKTRELFQSGMELTEIVRYFAKAGTPRTYLQCISSLRKGNFRLAGKIDRSRPWTPDEDQLLTQGVERGLEEEQIRKILYRTPSSVRARRAELALAEQKQPKKKESLQPCDVLSRAWGSATQVPSKEATT